LTPIGSFSTLGRTARDFGIDKTGPRLYAGNQQSDTIVQFDIDLGTVPQAGDVEWAVVAHAVRVET
jgi:6-phosphogluconolactonase (cycloisomerase 2 family)